ncbi:hypothetical protein OIU78_022826 [Salix suchowensis]|nr:hypothetical protein OIU78_022826 [Salix suchowensis]
MILAILGSSFRVTGFQIHNGPNSVFLRHEMGRQAGRSSSWSSVFDAGSDACGFVFNPGGS